MKYDVEIEQAGMVKGEQIRIMESIDKEIGIGEMRKA